MQVYHDRYKGQKYRCLCNIIQTANLRTTNVPLEISLLLWQASAKSILGENQIIRSMVTAHVVQ